MMFHPEDRVAHSSTDTGTGNLTISATAPQGYVTLPTAGYAVGDFFDGVIVASDGSGWESSWCQYVDVSHIARLQVYSNSLGTGAFINFTSVSKNIYVTFPATRYKTLLANAFTNGAYN